jgi:hypothetical protein
VGEILEWTGFAIACQSLPATAFAVYTFCNLFPRALAVSFCFFLSILSSFELTYFCPRSIINGIKRLFHIIQKKEKLLFRLSFRS